MRGEVRGVKSAQPGLDKTYPLDDGGKRARSPGSTKETVKTIACGNAGRFRCTRCYSCAFYYYKCTRGRGCNGHPAFPTPSFGRKIHQRPSRLVQRARGVTHGLFCGSHSAAPRVLRALATRSARGVDESSAQKRAWG